jgi:hypothetical protein
VKNLNRRIGRLARRDLRAFKKKAEPFFPNTVGVNPLEQIIVTIAVSLKVEPGIEAGLA